MNKACWFLTLLFACSTALLAYKFIVSGETVVANDQRTAILLTEGERDLVLAEMRLFLESIQEITTGISNQDMQSVAQAAHRVGMSSSGEVPASLVGKLPLAFKKLGFGTHDKFDELALNAKEFGDPNQALEALAQLMNNCVACHATYRLAIGDDAAN